MHHTQSNMKHFHTFESFNSAESNISAEIFDILEGKVSIEEIEAVIASTTDEGFFSWLKGIFTNGKQKRVLDKYADELLKTLIKKGTLELQGDPTEELSAELEAAEEGDDMYGWSGNPDDGSNGFRSRASSSPSYSHSPHKAQLDLLTNQEQNIIEVMDEIGKESEVLGRYVSKVKLEAKLKATEMLMKVADTEVKRVLGKIVNKQRKRIAQNDKDLKAAVDASESLVIEKAEGDRGPIDNPDIETALKKKSDESGIAIGLLRIVMRRGMDAWNSGHREGMGQEQWGYARVNAFIEKGKGTWGGADKDIAAEVSESTVNEAEETYNDYPAAAKANAKKAIEWKEKYGRDEVTGGTEVGWARAHQLAKGESLSKDVVSRMAQFNRHRKNSEVAAEFKDTPWKDRGYIAWLIWGGTEGVDWAIAKMEEIKEAYNINKYSPMSYAKQIASGVMTMQDAMEETGLPFTELMKLVKKIDKNFKINFESKDMKHFKTFESFVNEGSHKEAENIADQITGQIQDMINNDEEVDGAYYLVKDYFEGDTRNPLFNMVVDLVGKWMKKNKI